MPQKESDYRIARVIRRIQRKGQIKRIERSVGAKKLKKGKKGELFGPKTEAGKAFATGISAAFGGRRKK